MVKDNENDERDTVKKDVGPLTELQETARQLSDQLAAMGQEIARNMSGPAAELQEAVKKMAALAELQRTTKKISDSLAIMGKEMGVLMSGPAAEMREAVKKLSASAEVHETAKKIADSLGAMGQELSRNISALSGLQESASAISDKLASLGQEIADNISGPATELKQAIRKMTPPAELQERARRLSGSVGGTAKKISKAAAQNLAVTVDELRETAKRIATKKQVARPKGKDVKDDGDGI
jgi:polyhydroxyalkanoate synthesis regulator phasin